MSNYMVERPIGIATSSSSLFLVSRSVEDGTWCWGVVLIAVTSQEQYLIFLINLTWVAAASYFIGKVHEFSHSFD